MDNSMGTFSNKPVQDINDLKRLEQEVLLNLGLVVHQLAILTSHHGISESITGN